MHNLLWVQFENEQPIYSFYVSVDCPIKSAITDIEKETGKRISKASYKKEDLQP